MKAGAMRLMPGSAHKAIAGADTFLREGAAFMADQRVEALLLMRVGNRLAEVLAHPGMRSLRGLTLVDVTADFASELTAIGNAPQIETLDLSENAVGDAGAQAIAAAGLENLQSLRLYECQVRQDGAVALAQASFPALRELDLGNSTALPGAPHFNMIGPQGCEALAASPWFEHLEVLRLGGNGIGTAGALALAEVPLAARDVDLSNNAIEPAAVVAIASRWSRLQRIGLLHGNRLSSDELVDVYDPLDGGVIDQDYRPLTGAEIADRFGLRNVY